MTSLLGKLKKNEEPKSAPVDQVSVSQKPIEKPVKKVAIVAKTGELKGKSQQAHRVLVKPLVTEKAADMGAHGQYAFVVDTKMNKIEIKKAIRSVYNVEPVAVNIINMIGKSVRYGRSFGRRKNWKKAIVTLKPGDKIEIYEGV